MTPDQRPVLRRLARRASGVLAVGAAAYVVASLLDFEPDPVPVLLLTALAAAGLSLLGESVNPVRTEWYPPTRTDPFTRGRDGATFADLRLLESHLNARHPDEHLRRRLSVLADRALRTRRGTSLDHPEARDHLGADVVRLLRDPEAGSAGSAGSARSARARRLSPRDIDLCLRTIEEL